MLTNGIPFLTPCKIMGFLPMYLVQLLYYHICKFFLNAHIDPPWEKNTYRKFLLHGIRGSINLQRCVHSPFSLSCFCWTSVLSTNTSIITICSVTSTIQSILSASISHVPATMADPNWYPDTGETQHMTVDQHALQNPMPYTGTDSVLTGNGNNLPITQTDSPTTWFIFIPIA